VFLEFFEVLLNSFIAIQSSDCKKNAENPCCLIQHVQRIVFLESNNEFMWHEATKQALGVWQG
jgi:hypothetical protein